VLILLACTQPSVSLGSDGTLVLPGEEYVHETGLEDVIGPELGTNGEAVFDTSVLHEVRLEISSYAWSQLTYDPRDYAQVDWIDEDGEPFEIAIRLKGNTQFRAIGDKPSIIVDFNRYGERHWDGLSSVYLHNLTYDPSNLHEHLAYHYFREGAEVPASRSSFAQLWINDEDYGIYLVLEKQNGLFNERNFGESGGGTWEAGSFNHPCDLNDAGCDCWETDQEGDDAALHAFCAAATSDGAVMEVTADHVDWDQFLRQITAEMAIAHYDNYGWNTNNYRVHQVPSTGRFHWTPWSTDLAFGWYPWSGYPHCGEYGTVPSDHDYGYLAARCWADADCKERIYEGLLDHADRLEEADLVSVLETRLELIDELSESDGRSWYSNAKRQEELQCMRDWIEARPGWLREWVDAVR